jgi:hypothetical protein
MPAPANDRRSSVRVPAQGGIQISFEDPVAVTVTAELLDVSEHGFRASHESKRLTPGLEVRYMRAGKSGRARIMWTHILKERRVSGFMLL